MSNTQLSKTVLKEVLEIYKQEKFFDDGLATVEFDRNDLTKIVIVLCPMSGYFRESMCKFEVSIGSSYPTEKPKVKSLKKMFHPNVSSSGSVCFSMFGGDWKSSYRIVDYIDGLLFFLNHPNHNSPLESKCVMKNKEQFDNLVRRAVKGEKIGGTKYDRISTSGVGVSNSKDLYHKMKVIEMTNSEIEKKER